jgi:hypothetical protein
MLRPSGRQFQPYTRKCILLWCRTMKTYNSLHKIYRLGVKEMVIYKYMKVYFSDTYNIGDCCFSLWGWSVLQAKNSEETYGKENIVCMNKNKSKTNSLALSPQAKYTDWSTATCRWNLVPTFLDRGVSRGQRGGSPPVVNLSFLDRSRYFSFK